MEKPKKAYLVQDACTGFGFTCHPVIVLRVDADGTFARVAFVNVTANRLTDERHARVPLLGSNLLVRVSNLASTRLKALAKIAYRLRDLDEQFAAHLAVTQ